MASQLALPQEMEKQADALSQAGKTPLLFAKNGRLLGLIAVADAIKPESPEAIRQLRGMGIRVVMLTGDNARTAAAIGKLAGVDDVVAGVLPGGKEAVIRELQKYGPGRHGRRRHQRCTRPHRAPIPALPSARAPTSPSTRRTWC